MELHQALQNLKGKKFEPETCAALGCFADVCHKALMALKNQSQCVAGNPWNMDQNIAAIEELFPFVVPQTYEVIGYHSKDDFSALAGVVVTDGIASIKEAMKIGNKELQSRKKSKFKYFAIKVQSDDREEIEIIVREEDRIKIDQIVNG